MVEGRVHRMTELFGRLAPGTDLDAARAELRAAHSAIVKSHPEAYQTQADNIVGKMTIARMDTDMLVAQNLPPFPNPQDQPALT